MESEKFDINWFSEFERGLNTKSPEKSTVPAKVIGYGEISVVLEFCDATAYSDFVFKRLPVFKTLDESENHENLCREYISILTNDVNIEVPESHFFSVPVRDGMVVNYCAQKKLDPACIGSGILDSGSSDDVRLFMNLLLNEIKKMIEFNKANSGRVEITLDCQFSNWAFSPLAANRDRLCNFDVTTPLFRINGKERIDGRLFLRACPKLLSGILEKFALQEVIDRYYRPRDAVMDIISNFIKEGRQELIPDMIAIADEFFLSSPGGMKPEPFKIKEIYSYYRTDALIWVLFFSLKKLDRFIKLNVKNEDYDFLLPKRIKRNFPLFNGSIQEKRRL